MSSSNTHSHHDGPHADDPVKMKEHQALMDLVPKNKATHVAVNNGSWFDPNTWKGGKIPGDKAKVLIEEGVKVRYDGESDARLKTVRLDGTLTFAHNKDTKMVVDTFVSTDEGTLNIGTEKNPIQADKTAQIIIANEGKIDTRWDPTQLSRGVVTHGEVNINGAEKTDFIALSKDAIAGDSELVLKGKPSGWRVGDKLVLGGTSYGWKGSDQDNSRFRDEVLTITEINGNRVRFTNDSIESGDNTILRFDHVRPDIPEKDQLSLYVANTSRNVTIESEDGESTPTSQRGHTMFMHNPDVSINNAGFYHLGRSDKTKLVDDVSENVDGSKGHGKNPRGRYGLHIHRTGADDINGQAAIVTGNAVVDTPGWGIVHHDSHAVLKDNVVFDVAGAGIVAEAGNELGLWENNITIKTTGIPWEKVSQQSDARDRKFDLGFRGEGYWVQGAAQVAMRDNVAISANDSGITVFGDTLDPQNDFRDKETIAVKNLPADIRDRVAQPGQEEVDVTDVPLRELSGFESYNTNMGMRVWGQMTNFDGHLTFSSPEPRTAHEARGLIEDFKLWGNRYSGLRVFYSSNLDFKDGLIVGNVEKPSGGNGIFHNHATFQTNYKDLTVKGFKEGLDVEFLNEERDFTRSSIENSRFSDNTYNLRTIGTKAPKDERPDDLPAEFAIKNTVFEEQEGNKAPIARFKNKAAGGLSVTFDASASYDRDPLGPDQTSPKYPIDSKGIATYAWDFNGDGRFDDFGRKVTHEFNKVGTHDVTLQVLDNQGAAQTLTQAVQVKPTAYANAFKNSNFSGSKTFLEGWKDNSQWSDDGWFATEAVRNSNGAAKLSKVGKWGGAVGQVVHNDSLHQGEQTLSFRLKNLEGGDKQWQRNEVTVELWGVDGQFDQNYWEETGPTQVGTLPMSRTLLYKETFGGEDGEFFNWKTFKPKVNLGDGYQFLLFQTKGTKLADAGDFVAIDDVKLTGEAPSGVSKPSSNPNPNPDPQPMPPSVLPAPIASLKLDEKSGKIAADSSSQGTKNAGTLVGDAQWTSGLNGGAVTFDGKGDAIRLANSQDINIGKHDERTISLWFKADELLASGKQKQVLYEEGAHVRGLNIYLDGDELQVGGWNQPGQESQWKGTWLSTDAFAANEWNHVALVLDGSEKVTDGALKGYLNGKQFGEGKGSQLWQHTGGIGLGSINNTTRFHDGVAKSGHGFDGAIDEVMIFNEALTSSQVETLAA
ncbi:G8 domain-containing protein [Oscillatoria sp. CS-180]|uniref:G8 domain-containing protein n=1 Tax=Oscillatoria sp. CS-180 TaxID=3021720 RepID=UPI00232A7E2A|nr:G8 domain-containing protein [Oscillatoria sp. CS-180]MDB9525724.1 G8 domain-containing protein [Oscillatoria sp. CS-180]